MNATHGDLPAASDGGPVAVRDVIADRVRNLREARGWSQQRLADELTDVTGERVGRTTVTTIEGRGRAKSINVDDLHALALALDVSPVDLVCPVADDARVIVTPERQFLSVEWRTYLREGPEASVPTYDDAAARLEGIAAGLRGAAHDRRAELARDAVRIGLNLLDALAVRKQLDDAKGGK